MDIRGLLLDKVVNECRRQTRLFIKTGESDPSYCYELFRRAFAEGDELAFNEVYLFYKPQLERWAMNHSLMQGIDLTPEECASITFIRVQINLKGEQFNKKAHTLQAIIAYFHKTLNSVVIEEFRKGQKRPPTDFILDETPELPMDGSVTKDVYLEEIIARVFYLLPASKDRLLFIYVFVYEMTPVEIMAKHPNGPWKDTRDVTVRTHAIRKRLGGDSVLRGWADNK